MEDAPILFKTPEFHHVSSKNGKKRMNSIHRIYNDDETL